MTEDLEQSPPGRGEGSETPRPLPSRSPTRSGRHRAPDPEPQLDESHLVAIVTHLSTAD